MKVVVGILLGILVFAVFGFLFLVIRKSFIKDIMEMNDFYEPPYRDFEKEYYEQLEKKNKELEKNEERG